MTNSWKMQLRCRTWRKAFGFPVRWLYEDRGEAQPRRDFQLSYW